MARTHPRAKAVVVLIAMTAALSIPVSTSAAPLTCFGETATIVAVAGEPTVGTDAADVIVGTGGPDVINGRGGGDRICSRGGDDNVSGGRGADQLNLGGGNDIGRGGPGADTVRGKAGSDDIQGNGGRDDLAGGSGSDVLSGGGRADVLRGGSGSDTLVGNKGADSLDGGKGVDACDGQTGRDTGNRCESPASLTEELADTFGGTGALVGYTTNNRDALPEVGRVEGRYHAVVTDNDQNETLHFNESQGRLDAKLVEFPFDVVVRNIGIGTRNDSQVASSTAGDPFVFAGVQVHVTDLDDPNSAHVVVGHRGSTHFTIEGKNTRDGDSSVNDAGANIAPAGRADIRIVGNPDRTLTVYWQTPRDGDSADSWTLYRGTGQLPGPQAEFGNTVYIGLITYAFHTTGLPFVGTADAIQTH